MENYIHAAKAIYGHEGDLIVEDDAPVRDDQETPDGKWVQAWVFVPDEEAEFSMDDDDYEDDDDDDDEEGK